MKLIIWTLLVFWATVGRSQAIKISEEIYLNQPHFKIQTPAATYYLEKMSGGFSSIVDRDGKDWVAFSVSPQVRVPESAAADFRGVPNLVYQGADGGVGHPGFAQCRSQQLNERTIQTTSTSGLWQWTWTFEQDHAYLTLQKTDPGRHYWFLYEGPVYGRFKPTEQYWATDQDAQPRTDTPELMTTKSVAGQWQWAYFGDQTAPRALWVGQTPADDTVDFFAYMGSQKGEGIRSNNGMNVFGFGRGEGSRPLLNLPTATFFIGFYEQKIGTAKQHRRFGKWVKNKLR
jgi:hypothetical protein